MQRSLWQPAHREGTHTCPHIHLVITGSNLGNKQYSGLQAKLWNTDRDKYKNRQNHGIQTETNTNTDKTTEYRHRQIQIQTKLWNTDTDKYKYRQNYGIQTLLCITETGLD